MIVGVIDIDPTSESNRLQVKSSDVGTPTDTDEHGDEGVRSPLSESSVNSKPLPALKRLADYQQIQIRWVSLNTRLSKLFIDKMLQNWFFGD